MWFQQQPDQGQKICSTLFLLITCKWITQCWIWSSVTGLCSRMMCSLIDIMLVSQLTRLGLTSADILLCTNTEIHSNRQLPICAISKAHDDALLKMYTNNVLVDNSSQRSVFSSQAIQVQSQTLKQAVSTQQQQAGAKHVICDVKKTKNPNIKPSVQDSGYTKY